MNMEKINAEFWVNTYVDDDIDRIEIRSEEETTRATIIGAGQKTLASIIIRLALVETFCINYGVFVLDESTTNLDEGNIENLVAGLRGILESRRGQSNFHLIVITHYVNFSRMIGKLNILISLSKFRRESNGYRKSPESDNEDDDDE
ncbi:18516_t:CDS:2 [Dentiscutata erythropus]|uniref:18516_t:CDS:1 n=1 Tax=Dentiscutata erythropus TaxID=1348616 RepID=A0A9N9B7J4_9GLOM|nr:18516_t:CDS:2 [Dentiscutata erythropus]